MSKLEYLVTFGQFCISKHRSARGCSKKEIKTSPRRRYRTLNSETLIQDLEFKDIGP